MKIIFFGTSEFAVPALAALKKSGDTPAVVVTSPDRPSGRGMQLSSSPVKEFVKDWWLNILQPEKIDDDFIKIISDIKPEIGIVAAYGKILPKKLIDIFPKGILNIHPSLLPKYRGSSPIENTILAGEENATGVSIILLDEKMDHGPVLKQKFLANSAYKPDEKIAVSYAVLHDALAKFGAELLSETLPEWVSGNIVPEPQDESTATFTKLIKKEDGKIDWNQSAGFIERMTRAYERWPGTYADFNGNILKIKKVEIVDRNLALQPGTVFEKDGFPVVACAERAVKLLIVQPESKNEMPGDAYLRGHREILQ